MEHKIKVVVLNESGYYEALLGLSLNKNQPLENMPKVAKMLAHRNGGHNKFLEHMIVWLDVTAPRYFWCEADTYRLASKQSESTVHTLMKKSLSSSNFETDPGEDTINFLNECIQKKDFVTLKTNLPEGFMQRREWCLSYKTLQNIIKQREKHLLPHWPDFVDRVLEQVKHPEFLKNKEEK